MTLKKILFIDPFFQICGPHVVFAQLAEYLCQQKWKVIVVLPQKGEISEDLRKLNIETIILPGLDPIRRGMNVIQVINFFVKGIITTHKISKIMFKNKIALVHSATPTYWWGALSAKLCKVPSVIHVHDLTLKKSKFIEIILGNVIYYLSDVIICVSEAAKKALPLCERNQMKAIVVYNAVDLRKFDGIYSKRKRLNWEVANLDITKNIACVGGLDYRKGQDVLIEAAALLIDKVKNINFLIIGGKSQNEKKDGFAKKLQKRVKEINLQGYIELLGPRSDVIDLLENIDLFIQPSRIEAGPIAPLEAMAMGIPVIATNVGANPEEIINNYSGLIIEPENPQALAGAIAFLLRENFIRYQMGRNARSLVEKKFNMVVHGEKIISIYNFLIK